MPSGARGTRPRPGEWAPGGGGPSAEVAEQLVGVDGRAAGPACLITGEGPRRARPWQGCWRPALLQLRVASGQVAVAGAER